MVENSIIIPTAFDKRKELLEPCIESVIKFTDLSRSEIIVVANGCTDDTVNWCMLKRADAHIHNMSVRSFPEAIGYSAANNAGIEVAQGEFVILLNNDTILLEQEKDLWIRMLREPFNDPQMAITGPWMNWCPHAEHDFLIFFCVMIRKQVLNDIGMLDVEAFHEGYGEDCDLCCKAKSAGYKIAQVPSGYKPSYDGQMALGQFPIYHAGNKTFANWPDGEKLLARNREILQKRYGTNIQKAHELDGWINDEELRWLARSARKATTVIEVGSWHGKSTRALADNLGASSKLYAIDTWAGSETERGYNHASAARKDGDHAFDEFCRNLFDHIQAGRVIPLRMHGRHAANLLKRQGVKADLIFIDADHRYECVKEDIKSFLPLLNSRAVICGHDYMEPMAPGVEKAVHEVWGGNVGHPEGTTIWYSDAESIPAPSAVGDFSGLSPEDRIAVPDSESRPKVYDCFTFFNELELLDIRLHELFDVVDRFVLVEATLTHQGKPKPLYFQENLERFAPFLHKISAVTVDFSDLKVLGGPENFNDDNWTRERNQYEGMLRAMGDCKDNDIVIMGGADEIARAETVKTYRPEMGLMYLEQDLYYYYLNCYAGPWLEARILPYKMLKEVGPCNTRYSLQTIGTQGEPLPNGGWHFSFMGGPERIAQKIQSYAHGEYNKPDITDPVRIKTIMEKGWDVFGREGHAYKFVDIGASHPKYVQDNVRHFKDIGFIK